ncbi:hypothetical protein Tco_0234871, partial [Tanacetum coccineum]
GIPRCDNSSYPPSGTLEQLDWSLVGKIQIETVGEDVDEIDKQAELIGEMQLRPEDQGCIHASFELQLHVIHVVVNEHEVDQCW